MRNREQMLKKVANEADWKSMYQNVVVQLQAVTAVMNGTGQAHSDVARLESELTETKGKILDLVEELKAKRSQLAVANGKVGVLELL